LGLGKQATPASAGGGGTIQLLIFPVGTDMPPNKKTPAGVASKAATGAPVQVSNAGSAKP